MNNKEIEKITRCWIEQVVIGENFCPFAKPVFDNDSINYRIIQDSKLKEALYQLVDECKRLESDCKVETSLLIYVKGFEDFYRFLDLIELAEQLMVEQGYEGIYQLAHFHPDYCFEGVEYDDAQNFTNRSPYPILHLLREDLMEQALSKVKSPENIPERNIRHAQKLGNKFLSERLSECKQLHEENN